jgi:hypothetical protein
MQYDSEGVGGEERGGAERRGREEGRGEGRGAHAWESRASDTRSNTALSA